MMTVEQILAAKGSAIYSVTSDARLGEASRLLQEKDIGILVCTDRTGGIVGIVSERDLARGLWRYGADTAGLRVAEVMTRDVVACGLADRADDLLAIMTETRCRHIPVVDEGHVVGLVSIGDLVKARLNPAGPAALIPDTVSGPLVVAVDDDVTTRAIISGMLNKSGFTVTACANGAEMWAALERDRPRVVLLDIEMPGDDGLCLTEALRARYGFGISIVMLSSRDDDSAKAVAYAVGADDYLTKPCDWQQLVGVVSRHAAGALRG